MLSKTDPAGNARDDSGGQLFRLEPMDEGAYAAWRGRVEHEYGQDKVRAGNWPAEDADRLSREAFDELLPEGLATPGHDLKIMVNDSGERVGVVWLAVQDREPGRVTFIYDIEVEETHRRRGYARLALREVERYAREHGCMGVMLHVFGDNTGARELYRSEGFVETNVMMLKRVGG